MTRTPALLALLLFACTAPGVVGETNACVPSCDESSICDAERARCVECLLDRDCDDGERCAGDACVPRVSDEEPPDSGQPGDGDGDGEDDEGDDDAPPETDGDEDELPSDGSGSGDEGSGDEGSGDPDPEP